VEIAFPPGTLTTFRGFPLSLAFAVISPDPYIICNHGGVVAANVIVREFNRRRTVETAEFTNEVYTEQRRRTTADLW